MNKTMNKTMNKMSIWAMVPGFFIFMECATKKNTGGPDDTIGDQLDDNDNGDSVPGSNNHENQTKETQKQQIAARLGSIVGKLNKGGPFTEEENKLFVDEINRKWKNGEELSIDENKAVESYNKKVESDKINKINKMFKEKQEKYKAEIDNLKEKRENGETLSKKEEKMLNVIEKEEEFDNGQEEIKKSINSLSEEDQNRFKSVFEESVKIYSDKFSSLRGKLNQETDEIEKNKIKEELKNLTVELQNRIKEGFGLIDPELSKKISDLYVLGADLDNARNELLNAEKESNDTKEKLNNTKEKLNDTEEEFNDAEEEFNDAEEEFNDAEEEFNDAEEESENTENSPEYYDESALPS